MPSWPHFMSRCERGPQRTQTGGFRTAPEDNLFYILNVLIIGRGDWSHHDVKSSAPADVSRVFTYLSPLSVSSVAHLQLSTQAIENIIQDRAIIQMQAQSSHHLKIFDEKGERETRGKEKEKMMCICCILLAE